MRLQALALALLLLRLQALQQTGPEGAGAVEELQCLRLQQGEVVGEAEAEGEADHEGPASVRYCRPWSNTTGTAS